MQTKTETPNVKSGQPTVTAPVVTPRKLLAFPNLQNMPWVAPMDLVKAKMAKNGTYTPSFWQNPMFTSMMKGIYNPAIMQSPVFTSMIQSMWDVASKTASTPWFPPMQVVKQKLQTPKFDSPVVPVTKPVAPAPKPVSVTPPPGKKGGSFPAWIPSLEQVHQGLWSGLNFSTVALFTSGAIVSIQSPIKTVLVNLTKDKTILPPSACQAGKLGMIRALYAGTSASLSGSLIRTGYVTGAKGGSKPVEEAILKDEAGKEEGKKYATAGLGYVMAMALGDIGATQISESLSTLQKAGILPKNFKWKTVPNAWNLMMGGFAPRYVSGMVNFGALCVLEEVIAKNLPDHKGKHFTAGMLSGMSAAFFAYPFTVFKDYTLVRSTVTAEGNLKSASSLKLTKDLFFAFISSPGASAKSFGEMALKQVPIRMGLTGVIFALVAGVGEAMGQEPLKKVVPEEYQPSSSPGRSRHALFATKTETTPRIEELHEDTDEQTKTQTPGSGPGNSTKN
ncbi:hypothetical protein [Legionella cherrii]|uniref:Periplasmic ligand-binding sensor domain protein n=1 Tax=Legionella cherrii TaxID=28084 RepID=A0A0W0S6U6_9GAMM|nr:hypothetical protein [Legionella cherrii]KTC79034.1 periplasmic ligand-binding sensor domain protein [Legionella cherrii]VEB36415.1 periplasmic ligand-binding sensor domain protein [Legionella cherrii]